MLKPTKNKLIIALVVAVSSFIASEIISVANERIWQSVHSEITKEILLAEVPKEGSVSFRNVEGETTLGAPVYYSQTLIAMESEARAISPR